MIYPRFSHRHMVLMALFLLLTLGVLGLFFIMCIFNDTQLPFLVNSGQLVKHNANIQNWKYANVRSSSGGTSAPAIMPTPQDSALYVLQEFNSSSGSGGSTLVKAVEELNVEEQEQEQEQQHIYIDDVGNGDRARIRTPAPLAPAFEVKDYNIAPVEGAQADSYESSLNRMFDGSHYEFDADDDDESLEPLERHQPIASGSGAGELNAKADNDDDDDDYDMETRRFIKRISLKLLQLSKRNATGQLKKQQQHSNIAAKRRKDIFSMVEHASPSPSPSAKPEMIQTAMTKKQTAEAAAAASVSVSPYWMETRTRRIIGNERKSAERSRQLLLCEKDKAGGGELCRMLFKGT